MNVFEQTTKFFLILNGGKADAAAKETKSKKDVRTSAGRNVDELGNGAMEGGGFIGGQKRGSVVDVQQGVGAWCWGTVVNRKTTFVNGVPEVRGHMDTDRAICVESEVHAKERLRWTAGDGHCAKMRFQGFDDVGDDFWIFMGDFRIVDIPGDSALRSIDGCVGDAVVVWIDREAHALQGRGKKFVPKDTANDASVDGFVATDVKDFDLSFVDDVVGVFGVNVAKKVDSPTSESKRNEIFHESMEIGASDVGNGNVALFESVNEKGKEKGVVGYSW